MKIYLAGKISGDDWRGSIVSGLNKLQFQLSNHINQGFNSERLNRFEQYVINHNRFPIMEKAIFGQHDYCGPYFINCSHSDSYHNYGTVWSDHETGLGWCCDLIPPGMNGERDEFGVFARIVSLCMNSILYCDVVFAWINSADAYGTIAELGYAAAKGKRIWIATGKNAPWDDIWFSRTLAQRECLHYTHRDSPLIALQELLEEDKRSQEYKQRYSAKTESLSDDIPIIDDDEMPDWVSTLTPNKTLDIKTPPLMQSEEFQQGMEYARWLICDADWTVVRPEGYEKRHPLSKLRQAWAAGKNSAK